MVKQRGEELTEDEKKALRGSKFAPLPSLPPPRCQPRLSHPGGPLTTNKAAALAKFLERKLQNPDGLDSINPHLLERAVQNAKRTVFASGASNSGIQYGMLTPLMTLRLRTLDRKKMWRIQSPRR
ncbi:hypothetical protein D8674_009700 [Pyrus ussuriensis x Pyrus communis]|uniref:Uncharacterized protein n=1 Tax=Pyrus ussuriensis x Pyrus communis TaxID=2448454 RepID=A0A5N5F8Q0_9ROSA|nr:hypothetical protein D8674_009700 [Pyrus ussuriensis x Pyrus communis]